MINDPADWIEVAGTLNRSFGLERIERLSSEEGEALLAERLDDMARDDFNGLVALLYRVDVDETKLREAIRAQPDIAAGKIMARLVIERIWQKVQTRRQFGGGTSDWKEV